MSDTLRARTAPQESSGATGPITYPFTTRWQGETATETQNWYYAVGSYIVPPKVLSLYILPRPTILTDTTRATTRFMSQTATTGTGVSLPKFLAWKLKTSGCKDFIREGLLRNTTSKVILPFGVRVMTSKLNRRGILKVLVLGCSAVIVATLCLGAYTFHRLNRLVENYPQESASGVSGNQQEGAPYPADMEHLDQILSLKGGQTLPEGAHVVSVRPATNFARVFPGGWGYVVAFSATDSSIRAYVTERTGNPGELIERYPTALKAEGGLEDIDLSDISKPWNCGLGQANVLLERPLGRGWLVIRGGPR